MLNWCSKTNIYLYFIYLYLKFKSAAQLNIFDTILNFIYVKLLNLKFKIIIL